MTDFAGVRRRSCCDAEGSFTHPLTPVFIQVSVMSLPHPFVVSVPLLPILAVKWFCP